ncbi:Neurogenic locus notch protein 1 [Bulinus truncatus]|nr:Neurogenic locus notch protein 1 [Bulinus truncatus]
MKIVTGKFKSLTYLTKCGENYLGEYCQDDNPCRNGFCMNDGKCDVIHNSNGDAKAECTCPVGFVGKICDLIDLNSACYKNPCRNGGKCVIGNTLTNYTCKCLIGFRGQHCEKEDYCASQPCRNGGTCSPNEGGFECACLPGYRGVTCMEDVDECAQDGYICKNGGRCKNMYGSYNLDLGEYLASLDLGDYLASLDLGDYLASLDLGDYLASLDLGEYLASLDLGEYLASLDLGEFLASLDLGEYLASLNLGDYLASLDLGDYLASLDLSVSQ